MRHKLARRHFVTAIAALGMGVSALWSMEARAEYPEKPITLVIPYKAGGSTETMARVYRDRGSPSAF